LQITILLHIRRIVFPVVAHEVAPVFRLPLFPLFPDKISIVTMRKVIGSIGGAAALLLTRWFQAGLLESISRVK
jgi:hypothetical protein